MKSIEVRKMIDDFHVAVAAERIRRQQKSRSIDLACALLPQIPPIIVLRVCLGESLALCAAVFVVFAVTIFAILASLKYESRSKVSN